MTLPPAYGGFGGAWEEYALVVAGATPPTQGTVVHDKAFFLQQGSILHLTHAYEQSVAGSAGVGTYFFPIPAGFTIDVSKVQVQTTAGGTPVGISRCNAAPTQEQAGVVLVSTAPDHLLVRFTLTDIAMAFMGADFLMNYGHVGTFAYGWSATVPIL